MVDIEKDLEIHRFPWIYTKAYRLDYISSERKLIGYNVRIDILLVTNAHDPFMFDAFHFTSSCEMMDNASLAKECGLECSFASTTILVTPKSFSHIYHQIVEHEKKLSDLCV